MRPNRVILLFGGVWLLASCSVATFVQDGPLENPHQQDETTPPLPAAFDGAGVARYTTGYGGFFRSAQLDALIHEAAQNNPDYLVLRLRANRELLNIADTLARNGASLSASLSDRETRGPLDSSAYSLSIDLNPGLDVWGKTAADIRAGELGSRASLFDLMAAERALQKAIVGSWANLVAARITLSQRYARLDAYDAIMEATRGDVMAGTREVINLQLAEIDTLGARDQLEQQVQTVEVAQSRLNRLLGRPVGGHVSLVNGALPRFADAPQARLPAELLARRPDIQAAWARLLASDSRLRSARLAMLPRLNLSGSFSNNTGDIGQLFDVDRFALSLVASLTGTLLDNGASARQVELARVDIEIAVQTYVSTVLDALVEVDSVLSREHSLKRQIALQKRSAALAEDAFNEEIAKLRSGSAGLADVSKAALRMFNAQDAVIALRNRILQNRLDLYVALGDDYFDGVGQ